MRWGYWLVTSTFFLFFKLFHRHEVYGMENLPKGAAILAPNHASFYDPPILSCSIPEEFHYMAKEELFESFLFGHLISYLNAHPVAEAEGNIHTMKLICSLLQKGKKVVVFPEGTRSPTGALQELKLGVSMLALKNQVPVVPICITGAYEVWPIDQKFPKLSGKTSCIIGKPIYPQEFAGLGKREAQQALTKALQDALLRT